MSNKLFIHKRLSNFDFFFCFLTNKIFVKKQHVWLKQVIPSKVFFYIRSNIIKSGSSIVIKFFSKKSLFWSIFWSFVSFERHNSVGFFVDLELIGLGYRIRKVTNNLYRFFWGYANFVYLFVPSDVLTEYLSDERLIFFFGIRASSVNGLATYLMLLKKMSTYRVTGFVKPGKIIRLNSGKQR